MELIDNKNKTLKEDLVAELRKGSKVSIAASCFSIYAFEELKSWLKLPLLSAKWLMKNNPAENANTLLRFQTLNLRYNE